MRFEWDEGKAASNEEKHGVAFASVSSFNFAGALVFGDDRRDYGEMRIVAVGFIEARLHVLTYTLRGDTIRVISLRKANAREIRRYVEET